MFKTKFIFLFTKLPNTQWMIYGAKSLIKLSNIGQIKREHEAAPRKWPSLQRAPYSCTLLTPHKRKIKSKEKPGVCKAVCYVSGDHCEMLPLGKACSVGEI